MALTEEQRERVGVLIAALRSGEFTQAQQALRIEDAFCCLGVGCEVYRRTTGVGAWERFIKDAGSSQCFRLSEHDWAGAELPRSVAEWYGIEANPRLLVTSGDTHYATHLNDRRGYTFPQIADAFERTYLAPAPAALSVPSLPAGADQ